MRSRGRISISASALLLLPACGDSPSRWETPAALTLVTRTEHFVFHRAEGDLVDEEWQESYHAWAAAEFGLSELPEIHYYKYSSRSQLYETTGVPGNAWADPASFSIHTIWPTDNHEVVHLYASRFGSPPALFGEGFAVAHQVDPRAGDFTPKWSSVPLHTWASRFQRENRLIPIANLLETSGFRTFDDLVTYPEAGSFIRYLVDEHGLEKMLTLFRNGSPGQSAFEVRSLFFDVYGISIESAEESWKRFLGG